MWNSFVSTLGPMRVIRAVVSINRTGVGAKTHSLVLHNAVTNVVLSLTIIMSVATVARANVNLINTLIFPTNFYVLDLVNCSLLANIFNLTPLTGFSGHPKMA